MKFSNKTINFVTKNSSTLDALSRLFDAKLSSLNASDSVEKINSLFSSSVENNRITRPKAGQH